MRTILKIEAKGHEFVVESADAADRAFGKNCWKELGGISEWEVGDRLEYHPDGRKMLDSITTKVRVGTVAHVYRTETAEIAASPLNPIHEIRFDDGEVLRTPFDTNCFQAALVKGRISRALATP